MAATRSRAVDLVKLALALMVVGIHANPFVDLGRTVLLLTGEGIYRLAVPVFLVFNGVYLYPAIAAGRGWAVVRRIARLYGLWMLVYLPVSGSLFLSLPPLGLLRVGALGYWHLWYLSGLAMAAAALVALRGASPRTLALIAVIGWGLGVAATWSVATGAITRPAFFRDPLSFHRNVLTLGLPYAAAGLLIARLNLARRLPPRIVTLAAITGILALLAESLLLGQMPKGISHDAMASLGLAAPAIALRALQQPGRSTSRLASDLSGGLYFIHVFFVALLFRHTDLGSPAIWTIAVAGSVALTLALRRAGLARHLF